MPTTDEVRQRITSVNPPLMADIDRDGAIGDGDVAAYLGGKVFRFWTNEDVHKGDYVGQVADTTPNTADLVVNGRLDLVNLFPVKLSLKPLIDAWPSATFRLRAGNNRLRFCGADVSPSAAGTIQTADIYVKNANPQSSPTLLSAAALTPVTNAGVAIDPATYLGGNNAPGVLAFEAANEVWEGNSPELLVDVNGETLFRFKFPMAIDRVRNMYSWIGARHLSGEADYRNSVYHRIWDDDSLKSCVFFHGANVSGADAQSWSDAVFKRLWLSGAKMEFYSVDWRSDIGGPANYHQNASNAFVVASQLASTINAIPGDKVMIAHSLGNMVVSSMIQDYGLVPDCYLMCNSAVPAEAYDLSIAIRVPQLVHSDWVDYPTNSWVSSWHALFMNDFEDDRKYLGWPGRFSNVARYAVNFYSAGENGGDEILQMYNRNDIGRTTGVSDSWGHYSWHKQEIFKGRGGIGGTDWSGWNVDENIFGWNRIQLSEALQMADADFKTNTVFCCYPSSMNAKNIPLLVRGAHLAQGIPALTPSTGVTDLSDVLESENSFNLNVQGGDMAFPNNWPQRSTYPNRWLHSDMKDVAFYFNFKFYETVIEKGDLR